MTNLDQTVESILVSDQRGAVEVRRYCRKSAAVIAIREEVQRGSYPGGVPDCGRGRRRLANAAVTGSLRLTEPGNGKSARRRKARCGPP